MTNSNSGSEASKSIKRELAKVNNVMPLLPLIFQIEKQVVSVLLANELVKFEGVTKAGVEDYKFENVVLSEKGLSLFESDSTLMDSTNSLNIIASKFASFAKNIESITSLLTDEEVEDYRNLFPQGAKGPGIKIVKHRLEKFMIEHGCTLGEIMECAKRYIQHNSLKGYNIAAAHYFLSKRDIGSKIEESKCEEFLEILKTEESDWRDKIV
jgi:hypothetical protein